MKNLNLFIAGLLIVPNLAAATGSSLSEGTGVTALRPAAVPALSEGTGKITLSIAQRQTLEAYAENSRAQLVEALREAQGLSLPEANVIYTRAIKRVVIDSFASQGAKELLMRYVLNQALEMTIGAPQADGSVSGGFLKSTVNQDLITILFEDSIKLAIELYKDDRRFIADGSWANQPVMRVAVQRLSLAQKWNLSIVEQEVSFEFQRMALQQFVNTAASERNIYFAAFAEEINRAVRKLEELQGVTMANQDILTLGSNVRLLRRTVEEIMTDAKSKDRYGVFSR